MVFILVLLVLAATPAAAGSDEAMVALKAVRSVTQIGVTYSQYSDYVVKAKVTVDTVGQENPAQGAMAEALEFYALARSAWAIRLARDADPLQIGTHPAIEKCQDILPIVLQVIAEDERHESNAIRRARAIGRAVTEKGIHPLWRCAASRVSEAERLLKNP